MVCNWKPNSSRELNEHRMPDNIEGPAVPDHSDDSGNEDLNVNPGDYQLLPSDMVQGFDHQHHIHNAMSDSDSESDSDSDDYIGPRAVITAIIQQEQPQDEESLQPQTSDLSSTQTTQHRLEGWERTEISVNSDEIRSIMRGFSLPDSAVPEWASSVPEADFSSFVWDRMKPKSN